MEAQHEFGSLRTTWQSRRSEVTLSVIVMLFGAAATIAIFLKVFPAWFSSSLASLPITCLIVFFGLLVLGSCLGGAIHVYRGRVRRLSLYDAGLIYVDSHSSLQRLPWQEIRETLHTVETSGGENSSTTHTFAITCTNGATLTLDDTFAKLPDMRSAIEQNVTDRLFPAYLQAYQAGQGVVFGPLTVAQTGLAYKADQWPWGDIEIKTYNGYVHLKKKGRFHRTIIINIPNHHIFNLLVSQITSIHPAVLPKETK